jgi:hypothetical protein
MKSPKEIFESLQAKHGEYGEYVLLQQPYWFSNKEYKASAVVKYLRVFRLRPQVN